MNVLVCIKRVPGASAAVTLTDDAMGVDTRHVGYTVSPHEECAVEAAVQTAQTHGGEAVVLTIGPDDAVEQLREALAVGVRGAVHVVADSEAFGPADVARAVGDVVTARAGSDGAVDLVLLGNDAADTGDFQVGVRLAYRLGWPVVTGVRSFEVVAADDGARVAAVGDGPDGVEHFDLPLPAVLTVKEGGITPRYPSIPGRLKAKKAPVEVLAAAFEPAGSGRVRLHLPTEAPSQVEILGQGADAAPALVDVLERIGVVAK
jgi:electron transfer flavoprotein beta subunit